MNDSGPRENLSVLEEERICYMAAVQTLPSGVFPYANLVVSTHK
jgi:hypothetical protein